MVDVSFFQTRGSHWFLDWTTYTVAEDSYNTGDIQQLSLTISGIQINTL